MNKEQLKQDIKAIEAKLENMKQQLKEVDIEATQEEYPILKKNKNTGSIIKFTDISTGAIVWKGIVIYNIRHIYKGTSIDHTDTEIWEDVAYDKERNLFDGQPVYCWDYYYTHVKQINFYDAINKCNFTYNGRRNGCTYSNYEAVKPENYTDWMLEAFETLQR